MADNHIFQVVLKFEAAEPPPAGGLERDVEEFVEVLREKAGGLALGPVGGIDFASNSIELEFTVAAQNMDELYGKLREIGSIVLGDEAYEFAETSARRDNRELVTA